MPARDPEKFRLTAQGPKLLTMKGEKQRTYKDNKYSARFTKIKIRHVIKNHPGAAE